MTQSKTIEKKQVISVHLSERTADSIKADLKILKAVFEAQESLFIVQPSEAEGVQKLIDKLDHKQDQDGKPTGLWL